MDMHHFDDDTNELAIRITQYAIERLKEHPPELDGTESPEELLPKLEGIITSQGLGGQKAFDIFEDVIAPATISTDHPRYLAFVPNAPSNAASLIDLIVSASSMFGGTWLEGSGVVAAENQALRFICDMIRFPKTSGGVFVSGGTAANLSALIAARHQYRKLYPELEKERLAIACAPTAHSSVRQAAKAMDIDVINIPGDRYHRLTTDSLEEVVSNLSEQDRSRLFAVIASAGSTNAGYVDELKGPGEFCNENNIWFHVDGAYGGAGILCDEVKPLFDGIELADSFVVDPHKWLFSPFDSAALVYKNPDIAREAHSQHAEYLDPVTDTDEWNPSDYAHHLTRRARGLPLWFTLAVHGTDAIKNAITTCVKTTREAAALIKESNYLELAVEPQLSVLLFKRKGWETKDYYKWCDSMLAKQYAFIVPTTYNKETMLRICIVNPETTLDDISLLLNILA